MKPSIAHRGHRSNDLPSDKLGAIQVQHVVDPRTIPRSRHNPQFSRDQLSPALHRRKIHFRHMPWLAGLRAQTARMADGAMPAFAAMSTTCRRRSSMTAWRGGLTSRNGRMSCSSHVRRGRAVAL
ncbi:MAG: DUF488 family protein [Gemmatimonadaceae bacterium]|nr:DUF488 family protein [Gemmatimonadaceae bacterium]